jgi:hypothetical protein
MEQGIVIQGPTNYAKEIADLYEGIPNVVWSTWDGEDVEYIKSKGIDVVQSTFPSFGGHLNINYQTVSTYAGLAYLKNKGVTETLKIRSDLKIEKIKLFLEILKGKSISFLSICKPDIRPIYYELDYVHNSFDFPGDFIIYGTTKNLEKCFNFQTEENYPIPPESLIAYNYLLNSDIEFKLDYDHFIKNNISFFASDCLNNNIEIEWLKRSKSDPLWKNILHHSADKNLYNY